MGIEEPHHKNTVRARKTVEVRSSKTKAAKILTEKDHKRPKKAKQTSRLNIWFKITIEDIYGFIKETFIEPSGRFQSAFTSCGYLDTNNEVERPLIQISTTIGEQDEEFDDINNEITEKNDIENET